MDTLITKLAEKAVKCEKCKFAFSVAAFKEHTCFPLEKLMRLSMMQTILNKMKLVLMSLLNFNKLLKDLGLSCKELKKAITPKKK